MIKIISTNPLNEISDVPIATNIRRNIIAPIIPQYNTRWRKFSGILNAAAPNIAINTNSPIPQSMGITTVSMVDLYMFFTRKVFAIESIVK